ncbi:3-phosphoserine/phosphohydroxythreonine transaminase [Caldifermentibacillus hisashii]|uniref:Phosphoserine aminotransferase n=1 Tax=Caldibacillus thermoamylovorans TaxID=35841 RepID=A0A090J3U7_9BACI|nr:MULTISPECIES: 3-phosphoserine/phosphohydroxythreonine transaminase [Bacillaceae]KIO61694.1 Phosphoserine aminotransferase [Caldibacillus thermoamylovorans]MCB7069880.1 3-phosphoserine/phosphohydroxythreonine transaminase [Caldibacillus sp. 210928-DFI.2.22]MCB7073403.1 3-phosphoserine/phosphohydroxythreonine transaminase [Caldibacillus sp. 210928-DFI.2.18]MCM3477603.1 3-phosphoserine/phosphohydroxythreonine transaminase [Caldibacillus thermoamylovorans]MED4852034.1 3-phosphoserine/phosphohyd
MGRVYNFSAGPAQLPVSVLERAQEELLSYQEKGMSVMEMSHRSSDFKKIIERTEELIRELMEIPETYRVLFIQGGASLQFSMVPLNLLKDGGHAYYVNTGSWSKKALSEAKKIGEAKILASSDDQNFTYIPELDLQQINEQTDYVHITTNNTIEGTRFTKFPNTGHVPLVADASSNILSEQWDVSKFGLIYAGAQKNLGISGLTIVIIREDLIGHAKADIPTMLNYETYTKNNSLYNTPPTFAIYITMLLMEWLKEQGGVAAIEERNKEKANLLYKAIEDSKLFYSNVKREDRSLMNIPFMTDSDELNKLFVKEAEQEGLHQLKGHRSVGGMRASIYNAMPIEGVKALVDFMNEFERKHI